jgi:AAA15 family ATPase/GTPase
MEHTPMCANSQAFILDDDHKSIENGGTPMIQKVEIENFRCFRSLKVEGLRRINVIVGRNSSGKSAFLEALFISSGSNAANTSFQMRAIRRLGAVVHATNDNRSYESLWEDLFFNFDMDQTIHIEVSGAASDRRQLWISFTERISEDLQFGKEAKTTSGGSQAKFTWRRGNKNPIVSKPAVTTTGLQFGNVPVDFFPLIWFHLSGGDGPEETAKRFSELSKNGQIASVINAMKAEFDFLDDISLEFFTGTPMIFAKVKGLERKMPMGLISDGVNRLLAILLGIVYFKNGVVLIDQLEDGFFFERLPSIWKTVHVLSAQYNTQIFITTHSKELLDSLAPVMEGNEGDFLMLKAERQGISSIFTPLEGKFLEGALKQGLDPRQ